MTEKLREKRRREAARRAAGKRAPSAGKKAGDIDEMTKAVDSAATLSGGFWLSYLFVMFYLAVSAGAVTHADLLLIKPVKLPFLNVELPLLAFFATAPFLFLLAHAFTLLKLRMLALKTSRLHRALREKLPDETADDLRRLLPSNIFVALLAGPPELRGGLYGLLLRAAALEQSPNGLNRFGLSESREF